MPNLFPFVALLGASLACIMVGWAFAVLTQLLGLPPLMALIVLIIPMFAFGYVLMMSIALIDEKIWKFFGIYRLFNVKNKPIEKFFKSIAGIEKDG